MIVLQPSRCTANLLNEALGTHGGRYLRRRLAHHLLTGTKLARFCKELVHPAEVVGRSARGAAAVAEPRTAHAGFVDGGANVHFSTGKSLR